MRSKLTCDIDIAAATINVAVHHTGRRRVPLYCVIAQACLVSWPIA